jgi:integrase/recombinase XerD
LNPLAGIQRAHIELSSRHEYDSGMRDFSINTMMHGVRGFSGSRTSTASSPPTPPSTPACRRSTPTEPAPRAVDRLELIGLFLQVVQTIAAAERL